MRSQFFPDIIIDNINISVVWQGAGAEDVDSAIVRVLEPVLLGVDGVSGASSTSNEGRARISLEFEPSWDMGRAKVDVETALDSVTSLPQDSEDPTIIRGRWSDRVTDVVISGPVAVDQLGLFAAAVSGTDSHPMGRTGEHIVFGALSLCSGECAELGAPFPRRLRTGICLGPCGLWSLDVAAGAHRSVQSASEPQGVAVLAMDLHRLAVEPVAGARHGQHLCLPAQGVEPQQHGGGHADALYWPLRIGGHRRRADPRGGAQQDQHRRSALRHGDRLPVWLRVVLESQHQHLSAQHHLGVSRASGRP